MKILHLISSPRGDASFSIKLGKEIIERLQARHPGSIVKTRDLTRSPFPHLDAVHLHSFVTPPGDRTGELAEAARYSEEAITELMDADILVIGVPMYNFGIHSSLKTWIDHVARSGITFRYTAEGPEGLVKGKQAYLAVSTGGIYSEGAGKSLDFATPYLQKTLNFMGITDITTYRVEGTAVPELMEGAFSRTVEAIRI